MTTQKAIALRVSNLLIKNKLTRYAFCKKIAMPKETLKSIIDERYKTVKLDTIILICEGFGMSLSEFFNDDLFNINNLDIN